MNQADETRKIIDLLADGKITAEEAERLMKALGTKTSTPKKGRKIVFRITEEGEINPKINIAIPIVLAKIGFKFIPEDAFLNASVNGSNFDFSSINWHEIVQMASNGEIGDLFNLDVEEDDGRNKSIRIFVE